MEDKQQGGGEADEKMSIWVHSRGNEEKETVEKKSQDKEDEYVKKEKKRKTKKKIEQKKWEAEDGGKWGEEEN